MDAPPAMRIAGDQFPGSGRASMPNSRQLPLDLLALGLLALVIFLGLALLSYSPADPLSELLPPFQNFYQPDPVVYPVSTVVTNWCGRWGALVADILLKAFGWGAYYLVGSIAAFDIALLLRRPVTTPSLRAVGWLATLLGVTSLAAMVIPHWSPGPVVGAGGYLGALGRGLLESQFATVGGVILAASILMGGLLLCTDYWIPSMLQWISVNAASAASIGWARMRGMPASKRATDVEQMIAEDEEDEEKAPGSLSIRIGGKRSVEEDDEEVEAAEAESAASEESADDEVIEEEDFEVEEEALEEGAEKATVANAAAAPPAPAPSELRVRKPPQKSERDQMMAELDRAASNGDAAEYQLPPLDLLADTEAFNFDEQEKEVRKKAKQIEKTFLNFGLNVKVVEIETGPVIAQYEVELEAGLRLSKITCLADDLAIALRVPSVRIVAPIPGKNTVGIEVPNSQRQVVRLREVMEETNGRVKKMEIPIFLGKDVSGKPLTVDLAKMPHLLIAGRTGTGKSVCLNAIIVSMLMTRRPEEVRMLMIDPKMVELSGYKTLPHLMHPVVTDMRKAEAILAWAVEKMEERYSLLARAGVRHIAGYNQLDEAELIDRLQPENDEEKAAIPRHLPYIVIVADEIADMMMTAGKEVEQHIIRLAQKSRAVGIHLILATQKPTVDVVTGLIKSNLPARICFQVASRVDSRVVLDEMGADKLLGNGDMLFLLPGTSTLVRGQGTYLGDDEINSVVDICSQGEQEFVTELVQLKPKDAAEGEATGKLPNRDDLYEAAVDVVVREGRGSVSLLQRCLGIGYGRAARLIDFMAEDGVVGNYAGSQAREVLISLEQWEQMQSGKGGAPVAPAVASSAPSMPAAASKVKPPASSALDALGTSKPSRSTKIVPHDDEDLEEELDEDSLAADEEESEEGWDAEAEQEESPPSRKRAIRIQAEETAGDEDAAESEEEWSDEESDEESDDEAVASEDAADDEEEEDLDAEEDEVSEEDAVEEEVASDDEADEEVAEEDEWADEAEDSFAAEEEQDDDAPFEADEEPSSRRGMDRALAAGRRIAVVEEDEGEDEAEPVPPPKSRRLRAHQADEAKPKPERATGERTDPDHSDPLARRRARVQARRNGKS